MLRMRPFAMAPLVALVLGLVPATASARGSALTRTFNGCYFLADYVAGCVYSIGVDAAGEMDIVSYSRGRILKVVP